MKETKQDIIQQIVDSQLDKLYKLSKSTSPLTEKDIKSLVELIKLIENSEKLDIEKKEQDLTSLTPEELLLIKAHREKKK